MKDAIHNLMTATTLNIPHIEINIFLFFLLLLLLPTKLKVISEFISYVREHVRAKLI